MKVQVNMKVASSKTAATSSFQFKVDGQDLVEKVKERIAAAQLVAFPEQDLVMDGKVMDDKKTMLDYDVKESASLDFVIHATEESLLKQVSELLQARDLTCDELGLLYCYKYGVSLNQALKTVGVQEKFQEYIRTHKQFSVENGRVSLIRDDTSLKPFSVAKELQTILEEGGGSMDITVLASKFIQKFNVSMSSIVGMRPAEFLQKEKDLFVLSGRGQVSLKSFAAEEMKDSVQAPPATPPASKPKKASAGVAPPQQERTTEKEDVTAANTSDVDQMYQDLHTKISGRSFNSQVAQLLTSIVNVVTEKCFLNIDRVEKGGAVTKGTAITGDADAEIVFFVKGLPASDHAKWVRPLLKSMETVLSHHFSSTPGQLAVSDITVTTDSVKMVVKNLVTVHLRFSSTFTSYDETVGVLGKLRPEARAHFAPAFVKEKTQFVAKQTGQVKVTARLLRWWRNQQTWSSDLTRPSDEILELMAVYSALQTKPRDQAQAIANVMSLMGRFDELRIVWSNYYKKEQVWAPLMSHRPLLMDPANPFVNIADPQTFDPRELMKLARSTHFFY